MIDFKPVLVTESSKSYSLRYTKVNKKTMHNICSLFVTSSFHCFETCPQAFTAVSFFLFSFDGRVVAKLPFVPLSYIQGLSHRNLLGEDYTDCSFIFLYILCTMSIRQVSSTLSTTLHLGRFNAFHHWAVGCIVNHSGSDQSTFCEDVIIIIFWVIK